MDSSATSRRTFLSLAAGSTAAAALAACGSSGPSSGGSSGSKASYWFLSGEPNGTIRTNTVNRFNKANPNNQIQFNTYQNDAYKTKIKTAIGAGQAPTIIWGWGGGTLKTYVEAGQVDDLTSWFDQNPDQKSRRFASSFNAATVNGKIYALPAETVTPIVLYWNKKVFDSAGLKPPQSWGEIMDLVPKFNAKGIAPFSLGGQSRWTNMMWLEFLFDRIGGTAVFDAIFAGEKDAWSNPKAIDALTKVQQLVNAKGFINGFSSITADSNADTALLYTGRAAMMLHGAWTYGLLLLVGGVFVFSGALGYMNFPAVEGGAGDPSNTVGNPGQYYSISSKATAEQKETAKKFFKEAVLADEEIKDFVNSGSIPIIQGADSKLTGSKDAAWLQFVYQTASKAKVFAQSWDQALSPAAAEVLLDNIAKLFGNSVSPQQFAQNLNATIGK